MDLLLLQKNFAVYLIL